MAHTCLVDGIDDLEKRLAPYFVGGDSFDADARPDFDRQRGSASGDRESRRQGESSGRSDGDVEVLDLRLGDSRDDDVALAPVIDLTEYRAQRLADAELADSDLLD